MADKEIANKHPKPIAVSDRPDMCKVGPAIVPFDISRDLSHAVKYSKNVNAKGKPVITVDSVIKGVKGDAGKGVRSGVSRGSGDVIITTGADQVKTNKLATAHHLSKCKMNCNGGGTANTDGHLIIEKGKPLQPLQKKLPCNQPPKSSPLLDSLKSMKQQMAPIDPDQADSLVKFGELHDILNGEMQKIQAPSGANPALRQAAGVARGALGFVKDLALAPGELAYEGAKHASPAGMAKDALDSAILAENIRLGNVCLESMQEGLKKAGEGLVAPVTEPWKKGEYGESLTRLGLEASPLLIGKIAKFAKGAKALSAAEKLAEEEKAAQLAKLDKGLDAEKGAAGAEKAAEGAEGADGASKTKKTSKKKKKGVQVKPRFTRADARKLIDESEDREFGNNKGHAKDHVPDKDQDPKKLAESRPSKQNTTTFRSPAQAERDLRDLMNANQEAIDGLKPGEVWRGTGDLSSWQPGYNSVFGGEAAAVDFNQVNAVIGRLDDGALHLLHFSPQI